MSGPRNRARKWPKLNTGVRVSVFAILLSTSGCGASRSDHVLQPSRAVVVGSQLVLEFPGTVQVVADLSPAERETWPSFALDSVGPELRFRATAVFGCGIPEAGATVRGDLLRARVRPASGTEHPDCASAHEVLPVEVRVPVPEGQYRVEVALKRSKAFEVVTGRVRIAAP
jgi:hypothetical protein